MNRIFLVGYMGSGKTTVGQLLAEQLGYSFIDMDIHLEGKQFKSISQIFMELGEEQFRILEQQCLHEVSEFENVVISTGGGTPCFFDNMEYMNRQGITFYLKFSSTMLAERLEESYANKRPILAERKGKELYVFITEGLARREPYYLQAAYSVTGEIQEAVTQICQLLKYWNPYVETDVKD